MGERSYIGMVEPGGGSTVRFVSCHLSSRPSWTGRMLHHNYPSDDMVKALMDLGPLSSIGTTLDETTASHRDLAQTSWHKRRPSVGSESGRPAPPGLRKPNARMGLPVDR